MENGSLLEKRLRTSEIYIRPFIFIVPTAHYALKIAWKIANKQSPTLEAIFSFVSRNIAMSATNFCHCFLLYLAKQPENSVIQIPTSRRSKHSYPVITHVSYGCERRVPDFIRGTIPTRLFNTESVNF